MTTYQIYESGNYLIIDTYDDVARVVTASAQYAKKNSYYNKTANGYVITEFGGGEFPILLSDIAANIWTDNASVPLSESEIVDILQNQTGNFRSAAGGSAAVGAVLMKTGQTTSYRTGDDGALQAGRSVDFFTLENANPFGNTNRFTDELGGQTYANNIVIDWSTYDVNLGKVLGYYRLAVMAAPLSDTWDNLIDACLALSIGTFTSGWRMMNVKEAINIADYGSTNVYNYAPLNISFVYNYASSTTSPSNSAQYLYMSPSGGRIFSNNKTNANAFGIAVRNFTVSGTTLS